MSLTDDEIRELEILLREEEVYMLKQGLINPNSDANPNYKLLHSSIKNGKKKGAILEGSSRCFYGDQLVITKNGSKPIKSINIGDQVLSNKGFKKVTKTHELRNTKKCVEIRLKNGQKIRCTEDHKFYYKGTWVEVKDILNML